MGEEDDVEEIEINFRLDSEGRTALTSPEAGGSASGIDYSTRVIATHFVEPPPSDYDTNDESTLDSLNDELLFDCEIADSGLMPRTFWVPCSRSSISCPDNFEPRCTLEQMARDIFELHTAGAARGSGSRDIPYFDPATSGAEWWVQLRPSPERTGRYSMHGDKDDEAESSGISFHWDKDEDLRLLCGGSIYVHPHLSTVTYLTAIGAPTLVAEGVRVNNLTGEWIPPVEAQLRDDDVSFKTASIEAFVSWPWKGKHLCFDGGFLHAAPSDLQEPGVFAKQSRVPDDTADKLERRRHRRCTFLVNIWLNHKPFNVNPFPDTMVDKLSGFSHTPATASKISSRRMRFSFASNDDVSTSVTVATVRSDLTVRIEGRYGAGACSAAATTDDEDMLVQQFTWPMGDCDSGETIQASIPVTLVRSKANEGGSVRIKWQWSSSARNRDAAMILCKEKVNSEHDGKRQRVDNMIDRNKNGAE